MIDLSPLQNKRFVTVFFVIKKLQLDDTRSNRTLIGMQLYRDGWNRRTPRDGWTSHKWSNPKETDRK